MGAIEDASGRNGVIPVEIRQPVIEEYGQYFFYFQWEFRGRPEWEIIAKTVRTLAGVFGVKNRKMMVIVGARPKNYL